MKKTSDAGEFNFESQSAAPSTDYGEGDAPESLIDTPSESYPAAMIKVDEKRMTEFTSWVDQWIRDLTLAQTSKQTEWEGYEVTYRAKTKFPNGKSTPYEGACADEVPVAAMAVDPIHARLDTGIFKQDPTFKLKALKKSLVKYADPLEKWINFYFKNILHIRQIASPRFLECCKLGSMAFKTVYFCEKRKIKTYDDQFNVVDKEETTFEGPRVFGISMGDIMFPATYQHLQDCPIVVERQRTTIPNLRIAEYSKQITNVDKIAEFTVVRERTQLEDARDAAANYQDAIRKNDEIVVYEVWCDYDIDGDGMPERLVATYHPATMTFLQLRYNFYFNQRKPYTLIPYTVANDTLYGIGIVEMSKPFQDAVTKWQQMSTDNAYLANIRMFITKKGNGIENSPRLYSGRVFTVDDPQKDFEPFQLADVYPSTLQERQNLFGYAEKRSGVNDYLTGRESPAIGTKATATSTLALIQEGSKRVEQVLENVRVGFAEILMNCCFIWSQYGVGNIDDIAFGDDDSAQLVKEFFQSVVTKQSVGGAVAIDLSATDTQSNQQVMQQMQLAIIQQVQSYLQQVLQMGQAAISAQQSQPVYAQMVGDVMTSARKLFTDLLTKYNITNPEDYLPDLQKYLSGGMNGQPAGSPAAGLGGSPVGPTGQPSVAGDMSAMLGGAGAGPTAAGTGGGPPILSLLAGGNQGPQGTAQ